MVILVILTKVSDECGIEEFCRVPNNVEPLDEKSNADRASGSPFGIAVGASPLLIDYAVNGDGVVQCEVHYGPDIEVRGRTVKTMYALKMHVPYD